MSHHPLVLCLGGGGGGGGKIQRHAVRKMGACSMLELRASNNIGVWGRGLTVSTTCWRLDLLHHKAPKLLHQSQGSQQNWTARRNEPLDSNRIEIGMRGACMREPSPRAVVAENGSVYEQLHAKEAEAATAAGGKKRHPCWCHGDGTRARLCQPCPWNPPQTLRVRPLRRRTSTSMRYSGEAINSEKGGRRRIIWSRNFYKCI